MIPKMGLNSLIRKQTSRSAGRLPGETSGGLAGSAVPRHRVPVVMGFRAEHEDKPPPSTLEARRDLEFALERYSIGNSRP